MTKAEIATEIAKTTGIDKASVVNVIEQLKLRRTDMEEQYKSGQTEVESLHTESMTCNCVECQDKRKYVQIIDVDLYIDTLNDWD